MPKTSAVTRLANPHPGEILVEEFLKPRALSQNTLARALGVPPRCINEIVLGTRAVTADTDLRLARYLGMSEGFFLGLQSDFDLLERRRDLARRYRPMTYKGYRTQPHFDVEDGIFFGHLDGIRDIVGFHADTVPELRLAFRESVDDYVATCAKIGRVPQRPRA